MYFLVVFVLSLVAVYGLAGVECVLRLLLEVSGSFFVLTVLSSIKIWYAFGVLLKKTLAWRPLYDARFVHYGSDAESILLVGRPK
jgi:hypothetical protein